MGSPEIEPMLETEREYRAIEATLLQTARGRWFLAEHSRRSRRLETNQLEEALLQLKSSMREPPALLGRLQSELDQIIELLRTTRTELLARQSSTAGNDPAQSVSSPSTVSGLLKVAEDLHETVWSLQSREMDPELCERIGRQTAAIFTLTARQAQESQRVAKFAEALDHVAKRVSAALETVMHEAAGNSDNKAEARAESKSAS